MSTNTQSNPMPETSEGKVRFVRNPIEGELNFLVREYEDSLTESLLDLGRDAWKDWENLSEAELRWFDWHLDSVDRDGFGKFLTDRMRVAVFKAHCLDSSKSWEQIGGTLERLRTLCKHIWNVLPDL